MLFLNAVSLAKQGISLEKALKSSEIICSGKNYTKDLSFDNSEREAATTICKKHIESGIFSFVLETPDQLIVWKEIKANHQNFNNKAKLPSLERDEERTIIQAASTVIQKPSVSNNSGLSSKTFETRSSNFSYPNSYNLDVRGNNLLTRNQNQSLSSVQSSSTIVLNDNPQNLINSTDNYQENAYDSDNNDLDSSDNNLEKVKRRKPKIYRGVSY